jgi:hypothetical protein
MQQNQPSIRKPEVNLDNNDPAHFLALLRGAKRLLGDTPKFAMAGRRGVMPLREDGRSRRISGRFLSKPRPIF